MERKSKPRRGEGEYPDFTRVNISLASEVKDWYMLQSKKYGTTMSGFMCLVLTKHYESEVNMNTLKKMTDFINFSKVMEEDINFKEMNDDFKQFISLLSKLNDNSKDE